MAKIILQVTGNTIQVVTKITKKAYKALTTVGDQEVKNEQGKTVFVLGVGEPEVKTFAVTVDGTTCIADSFDSDNVEETVKRLKFIYAGINSKLNKAEKLVCESYDALVTEADSIKVVYTDEGDE